MTNPLFDQANEQADPPIDNPLEVLVGEGKKYRDANALALAAIEKDRFIEQLKTENAQMRNSLKGEQKIDEFLTKLQSQRASSEGNNQGHPSGEPDMTNQNNTPKAITLDEVEEVLSKRERENTARQNVNFVVAKVKEAFGANYQIVLGQKASELSMTPEELLEVAKSRPQAFLKLVEADKLVTRTGNPPPASSVNTNGLSQTQSNEKNYTYYEKLRKELGDAKFFAPKIQNELHKDALRLGAAFYP